MHHDDVKVLNRLDLTIDTAWYWRGFCRQADLFIYEDNRFYCNI